MRLAGLPQQIIDGGHAVYDWGDLPTFQKNCEFARQPPGMPHLEGARARLRSRFDERWPFGRPARANLPLARNAKQAGAVGASTEMLSHVVTSSIRQGQLPLVLGGDHSLGIGSLAGVLRAKPDAGVIWVDSCPDLNTPSTSPTGNMHGMTLGLMVDDESRDAYSGLPPAFDWLRSHPELRLDPKSLVYVGLRDFDPGEVEAMDRLGLKAFSAAEIHERGIDAVMADATTHLGDTDHIHMSFDVASVAPSDSYRRTGTAPGLSRDQALAVATAVGDTGKLKSMDVVELNPRLTSSLEFDMTTDLCIGVIASALSDRGAARYDVPRDDLLRETGEPLMCASI